MTDIVQQARRGGKSSRSVWVQLWLIGVSGRQGKPVPPPPPPPSREVIGFAFIEMKRIVPSIKSCQA